MKIQNFLKKPLAVMLAGVIAVSAAAPVFAAGDISASQEQTKSYTYTAPTAPMAVDENIITASAHRAASPALGIMGVNATSGYGMINGAAPTDLETAQKSAALGIWGSSLNSNPDPYYWNYFYNYYAEAHGLELSGDVLINPATGGSGGPQTADMALLEEYGNLSVSISTRPDILLGVASSAGGSGSANGYDSQIAAIRALTPDSEFYQEGDENYSPKQVSYQTTTIKDMIASMHAFADAITEVENETGKTTRYGDVQVIADDYEKYIYGTVAYVQARLAADKAEQKTVAVLTAINEDGTYSLADSTSLSATSLVRAYEYSSAVTKSLTEVYGKTVTLDQLLTADVIITINNRNITQTALEESFGTRSYDGIIISTTPSALYGVTMNSVENAMGYAYIIGCMYSEYIDPVELCAYFYQNFLHISDLDSLQTVVKTNFADTILPAGVSTSLDSGFSSRIARKLTTGMKYYEANKAQFSGEEYSFIGMDNWQVQYDAGIGSNTRPENALTRLWDKAVKALTPQQ